MKNWNNCLRTDDQVNNFVAFVEGNEHLAWQHPPTAPKRTGQQTNASLIALRNDTH